MYFIKKIFDKKIFLIIVSILITCFGVLSFFLGSYSQNNNKYIFYTSNIDNNLFINEIKIGDSIVNLNDYSTSQNKYDKELKKIKLSENQTYEINISKIDNLKISFENGSKEKNLLIIEKNNKIITKKYIKSNSNYTFSDNTSTSDIIKSIIKKMSLIQYILITIIFITFTILVYLSLLYLKRFFNNLSCNKLKISNYVISSILLFLINLIYIFPLMQIFKYCALIPMSVILIILIYKYSKNKTIYIENYYITISMFIGILFLFTLPPLHVPDEFSHFIKSYQTSFAFQENNEIKDGATFVYLPNDFKKFIIKYDSQTLNYDFKMQPRTYFYDIFKVTNYKNLSKQLTWYSLKNNNPFPYLIGTIMSVVARISHMPIILLYYLSKLFCFIISTLMCYYAIKVVPKFKKIFFIVPLLPIFIQQSFGINVDWLTNCTFILLLAYIIKSIYNNNKISKNELKNMIILSVVLGFCKFGYFPIVLLFTLIPNEKNSKRNKIKYLIMIILIILPFIPYIFKSSSSNTITSAQRNIIPVSTIVSNPKMIIKMLIETFKIRLDLDLFRGHITGFGWSTIWLNDFFLFISMSLLMILILCDDSDNTKLNKKQKIIFSISFLLICGIIYAAMLFQWSEIGSTIIDGLQPRYFIPPIMLLYILLQNQYIKINLKNKYLFYSIAIILINILGLWTIVQKIYV